VVLKALSIADATAIAAAAAARTRDERAMLDYVGIGRRRARPPIDPAMHPLLVVTDAADLAAFDGGEQRQLQDLISRLTVEARRELIALAWLGKSLSLSFEAAMRRARRVPPDAQVGYLTSRRLELHIPAGLEKLTRSYRAG
jgi:hypothetical protein